MFEVGDTGTSTCLLIFENLLRFNQPILINWVPGSMGWAYVQQRTKKINKHEYLILNLGWHLLQQSQTSSNLQFEPYKTGNENAKNHEFFRAQNILSFFVLCIQPIYLFIYSVPDSEHPILCHVYSKRFLRHDLCQVSKKTEKKFGPSRSQPHQ